MSHFQRVNEVYDTLPYMREPQAVIMRDFIQDQRVSDILEIGFFQGKSSAYFAAILEDLGRGHLMTIDKQNAKKHNPNILDVLSSLGLALRVTPVFAVRSHTWELGKLIRQSPRPQFDMCYFDGGHTWDVTGFGFMLVDMLLKPGGWIIFDDLDWTIASSVKRSPDRKDRYKKYSRDERSAPGVRMVFESLLPYYRYENMREDKSVKWGFAQKPLSR
jgi:predicted O-methyltransferase YrrM